MVEAVMEAMLRKEAQDGVGEAVEEAIVQQMPREATRLPEGAHHQMAAEAIQAEKVLLPVAAKAVPPVVDAARMEEKVLPAVEDSLGFG